MDEDETWSEVFHRFVAMGRDPERVPMWEIWQMYRTVQRAA